MRALTVEELGFVSGGDIRGGGGKYYKVLDGKEAMGLAAVDTGEDGGPMTITALSAGDRFVDSEGTLYSVYDSETVENWLSGAAAASALIPGIGLYISAGITLYVVALKDNNSGGLGAYATPAPLFTPPGPYGN
jgi:hypothetical protein